MPLEWGTMPLLPLRCILDHLSTEDAMAAMATCRHWRSCMLLYEGRKETLTLKVRDHDQNVFLTRIFRKNTERLIIQVEDISELDSFVIVVLPEFFDSENLKEIVFVGPRYLTQNPFAPIIRLNRVILESLIFKHSRCLQKVVLLGVEIARFKHDEETYLHKNVKYYSRPLSFSYGVSDEDLILTKRNAHLMGFTSLKHILLDYDQVNFEALATLSHLKNFKILSLNIIQKRTFLLRHIDWRRLNPMYPRGLEVAVNIISVSRRKFNYIVNNVLVPELPLTSLKVLFCRSMYTPLLGHIVRLYQMTLRELVWADSPFNPTEHCQRYLRAPRNVPHDAYNVNPFVLLCWQCANLQRLVIHGYWVWQYDLLGFVRLRKGLCQLDVSAIYRYQDAFKSKKRCNGEDVVRVYIGDHHAMAQHDFIDEVNLYTDFNWKPCPWNDLHPALRDHSTTLQRSDYIIQEVRQPLDIT